jgi:hypothetical protein
MNDHLPTRTDAGDDWLEDLLRADGREHRAEYLDDDGFAARVMSALRAAGCSGPGAARAHRAVGVAGVGSRWLPRPSSMSHEILRVSAGNGSR